MKTSILILHLFDRSPSRIDSVTNSNINNRLRRTLASRSMSAEVFRSPIDTVNTGNTKKSTSGQTSDENISIAQSQIKLMPILEGGENEDKLTEASTTRRNLPTTTIAWTPTE